MVKLGAIALASFKGFSAIEIVDAVLPSDDEQSAHHLECRSQILKID